MRIVVVGSIPLADIGIAPNQPRESKFKGRDPLSAGCKVPSRSTGPVARMTDKGALWAIESICNAACLEAIFTAIPTVGVAGGTATIVVVGSSTNTAPINFFIFNSKTPAYWATSLAV